MEAPLEVAAPESTLIEVNGRQAFLGSTQIPALLQAWCLRIQSLGQGKKADDLLLRVFQMLQRAKKMLLTSTANGTFKVDDLSQREEMEVVLQIGAL